MCVSILPKLRVLSGLEECRILTLHGFSEVRRLRRKKAQSAGDGQLRPELQTLNELGEGISRRVYDRTYLACIQFALFVHAFDVLESTFDNIRAFIHAVRWA